VPKELFGEIKFIFVDNVTEVFREALKEKVQPPAATVQRTPRLPQAASAPRT